MPKAAKKTLKDLQPVIVNHKTKIMEDVKSILRQEVQVLFDDFPDIQAIRWTQRRPLESPEFAPIHKSDFAIDSVQYRLGNNVGARSVSRDDPMLRDCGYDKQDDDWVCPWNDSRVESPDLLDSLTVFEEHLFDAQESLAAAIGDYDCVTVTRKEVVLDNF